MQPEPPAGQPTDEPAETGATPAEPAATQPDPSPTESSFAPAPSDPAPPAPATPVWPPVAQPPQPAQWPPVAPIASPVALGPPRPGVITAAAIVLIVFGAILGLIGLLVMLGGALFSSIKDQPELVGQLGSVSDAFGVFILIVGAVMATWGGLQVFAAIFVLRGRTWARITAMILAILGALIGLSTIIPGENGVAPLAIIISLVIVGAHAFAIWALASQGRWFSEVSPAA